MLNRYPPPLFYFFSLTGHCLNLALGLVVGRKRVQYRMFHSLEIHQIIFVYTPEIRHTSRFRHLWLSNEVNEMT